MAEKRVNTEEVEARQNEVRGKTINVRGDARGTSWKVQEKVHEKAHEKKHEKKLGEDARRRPNGKIWKKVEKFVKVSLSLRERGWLIH